MATMAKAPAPTKAPPPKREKSPSPPEDDASIAKGDEKAVKSTPKSKLKLALLVIVGLALGVGGTVGVMTFLGGSKPALVVKSDEPQAEADQAAPPVAPQRTGGSLEAAETGGGSGGEAAQAGFISPFNIEFKPFIVNLSDIGGRRMLKLTMSVEADTQELADEINAKMPQFRDTILLLLSSIQSEDVSGLDGKQRLKNQMINRINPNLTRGKIRNLYFSEIVVQ